MINIKTLYITPFLACGLLTAAGCQEQPSKNSPSALIIKTTVLPASDLANQQGWQLNTELSDEFDGNAIDRDKWFVQGDNGDYYIWKGRAPAQFAPHNIIVSNGTLKIRSQWEPDYDFAKEEYAGNTYGEHDGKPMPVTTGGIISKKRFLHGYMEVRSKAGHAAMTSAFWAIGYQSELDIYELMGNPKRTPHISPNDYLFSIHDWRAEATIGQNKVFTHAHKLPHATSQEFHIYGAEWGEGYVKFFLDGELVYETTQEEIGDGWVLTNPLEIWLDSEIFTWQGLPHKEELPVNFEIDYMRVWQKPTNNLLDRAFYGFEGPLLYEEYDRPLGMVPEDANNNNYQRFWIIDERSAPHIQIVNQPRASGRKSLKLNAASLSSIAQLTGPKGSVYLPTGEFELSLKVFKEADASIDSIQLALSRPQQKLPAIDISALESGQWHTVSVSFKHTTASETVDRLMLNLTNTNSGKGSVYIDDIAIIRK